MKYIFITFLMLLFTFSASANPFAAPQKQAEKPTKQEHIQDMKEASNPLYDKIFSIQKNIHEKISHVFKDIKDKPFSGKFLFFLALCFIYGIFHAIGPGHAKTIVSSFIISSPTGLFKSILFGFLVAVGHAFTAFVIVVIIYYFLHGKLSSGFDEAGNNIGIFSYGIILAIAIFLFAKKIFLKNKHSHDHKNNKSLVFSALTVGLVPCPGSMVLTVFAVSNGMLTAGVFSVLSMALGMAVTICSVAVLSYYVRELSVKAGESYFAKAHHFVEYAGLILLVIFSGIMLSGYIRA